MRQVFALILYQELYEIPNTLKNNDTYTVIIMAGGVGLDYMQQWALLLALVLTTLFLPRSKVILLWHRKLTYILLNINQLLLLLSVLELCPTWPVSTQLPI